MIKAVVFDIDGTLTPNISWTVFTNKLGASVDKHLRIYQDFKEDKLTYEKSKEHLLKLWKETGNAHRSYIENLFEKWTIRKEAKNVIKYLKSKGYVICLITGSIDLYAKIIAKRLEIKYFYSNTMLVWDRNSNLIDFHYHRDQGKKKLEQFLDFCQKLKLDPQNCLTVGDDDNDIQLFKYTGKGIAVKSETSYKLEKYAWKKIDNLLEIKDII